ncbi:MAG: SGNH/GDSL hydrolase family protein [Clostridiaceae bacterium]|nr:SGNH/GDSL hydrolase family protein [Clostridiaceae bacterium]
MIFGNDFLNSAVHNSVWTEEDEEGFLYFRRFTPSQMQVYSGNVIFCLMSRCSTGVYLLFQTTGNKITLICKKTSVLDILPAVLRELGISRLIDMGKELKDNIQHYGKGRIHIEDSFDVFVDGVKVAEPKPKSGRIRISLKNPGHKPVTVKICFPIFAEIGIKEIRCNGDVKAINSCKEKMYCFGDSITQGFVAGSPSLSYTARLADALNLDALNQGVGSYYFDVQSLADLETLPKPKLVTVAYGTNDWTTMPDIDTVRLNVKKYFNRLYELFPGTPVLVITPIWRGDMNVLRPSGSFEDVISVIKDEASKYENISIIDGLEISSHKAEDYADGFLHPNKEGFRIMAERILKKIKNK